MTGVPRPKHAAQISQKRLQLHPGIRLIHSHGKRMGDDSLLERGGDSGNVRDFHDGNELSPVDAFLQQGRKLRDAAVIAAAKQDSSRLVAPADQEIFIEGGHERRVGQILQLPGVKLGYDLPDG